MTCDVVVTASHVFAPRAELQEKTGGSAAEARAGSGSLRGNLVPAAWTADTLLQERKRARNTDEPATVSAELVPKVPDFVASALHSQK